MTPPRGIEILRAAPTEHVDTYRRTSKPVRSLLVSVEQSSLRAWLVACGLAAITIAGSVATVRGDPSGWLVTAIGVPMTVMAFRRARGVTTLSFIANTLWVRRPYMLPGQSITIDLTGVRDIQVFRDAKGFHVVARADRGSRVVLPELSSKDTALYLARVLTEEVDAARPDERDAPDD